MFHSDRGAQQEAEQKFVEPLQLRQKALLPRIKLLDICYGLGYNTAAALAAIWHVNPECQVEWVGLELNLEVSKSALKHRLLDRWPVPIPQLLAEIATQGEVKTAQFQGKLLVGDARKTLQLLQHWGFQADAIFLDPFSPPTCPQLWTVEFLRQVAKCLLPEGRIATYSCAAAVRNALLMAELSIGSTAPVGRRSPGTVASWPAETLPSLSLQEQEHLLTKAGIPYRDPHLCDSAETILQRRQAEQQVSLCEPTSHWKKRWLKSSESP